MAVHLISCSIKENQVFLVNRDFGFVDIIIVKGRPNPDSKGRLQSAHTKT
jgi:hypothetical protein